MCVVCELSKLRPYAVYFNNTMDTCPSFAPRTHRTKANEMNTCSLLKMNLENKFSIYTWESVETAKEYGRAKIRKIQGDGGTHYTANKL